MKAVNDEEVIHDWTAERRSLVHKASQIRGTDITLRNAKYCKP